MTGERATEAGVKAAGLNEKIHTFCRARASRRALAWCAPARWPVARPLVNDDEMSSGIRQISPVLIKKRGNEQRLRAHLSFAGYGSAFISAVHSAGVNGTSFFRVAVEIFSRARLRPGVSGISESATTDEISGREGFSIANSCHSLTERRRPAPRPGSSHSLVVAYRLLDSHRHSCHRHQGSCDLIQQLVRVLFLGQ
jgi:hypothetical protein